MIKDVFVSITQDNRRPLKNGKYPLRLRVFTKNPRSQKLYPTQFELPKGELTKIESSRRNSFEEKELLKRIQKLESHAQNIIDSLETFSFENFENILYKSRDSKFNVISHFEEKIETLKNSNKLSTAESYSLALNALKKFYSKAKRKKDVKQITFVEINEKFLDKFEYHMTSPPLNRSLNTVGIYLRNLRHIFNSAIENDDISQDCYPFGKGKYVIPSVQKVKQVLSQKEIKELYHYPTSNEAQEKAKQFWFFSYSCNGMNMKDIANLRYRDINKESLTFYRSKIANTSKSKQTPVIVYLSDFAKNFINKYGNLDTSEDNYVFPIINEGMDLVTQKKKIKDFTNNINKRIRSFYPNKKLTFYWARHSFATNAIRNGASMEYVSEALSHQNMKTTQAYFAGFEAETKKEFAKKMMDF